MEEEKKKPHLIKRLFSVLGPGLVTGAADDDPSGIATYSIAGAQLGMRLLWLSWLTWPMMGAVQMMCARIGMVTGRGITGALGEKFPRPLILFAVCALFIANTINVGSDLAGMADAAQLLSGVSSHIFVVMFGIGITIAIVRLKYHQIAGTLKWLALSLFAYVITAFLIHPDWSAVSSATFSPAIPKTSNEWSNIVAILGTTISPYLFFWQASQEVEEEKAMGRRMLRTRVGTSKQDLVNRMMDVGVGTFLSNIVMFFIILTTALTLNAHGITEITTSKQAAEALRPLAGNLATTLYTVGILAVGFLAIPTLAGSAAYAFAEFFNWAEGLDNKLRQAKAFYVVIIFSIFCGIGIDFLRINPMKALYWTAIINGIMAPFMLIGIIMVARDKVIMHDHPSSKLSLVVVTITTLVMFFAAIAMFVF